MKFSTFQPPGRVGPDGKPRYSTFYGKRKPMQRARMNRRAPKRLRRRASQAPYLVFIRSLPCISCGSRRPSDAAHMPVGPRGVGLKSPDTNTVPLCRSCHRWFDGHTNPVLPREERRALAVTWLAAVQLAVTPGDDKRHAYDLAAAGLGTVEEHADGRWSWLPGDADERREAA